MDSSLDTSYQHRPGCWFVTLYDLTPLAADVQKVGALLIERVPLTCPASTPDPVTAWMAVAGSGVSPRQATLEAPVLPANRRKRRQPPGRTRDSMPLSEAGTLSRQRASVARGVPTRVMRYANLVRAARCVVV